MGKISNYTRALVAKLQDVFVVDQTDNNVTATKSVTVEQIGDAICGEQVHSDLKTDNQTIIGGINELAKAKNIADEYDDTHTYNIGDVTIYGNTLYICNTNNTTGTFDPSKWTATTIDDLIPKTDNNLPHYTGTPTAGSTAEAIGDLTQLTTTDKSSLVGAVKEVNGKAESFIYTDSAVTDFITLFASIPNNKTVGFLMNSGTVSNCPVPYPTGVIAKWNSNTAFIELTQLNGTDASYIGRVFSGNLTWRKITTTAP